MSFLKKLLDGLVAADETLVALDQAGVNVDRLITISNAQGEIAKGIRKILVAGRAQANKDSINQIDVVTEIRHREVPTVKQLTGKSTQKKPKPSKKKA